MDFLIGITLWKTVVKAIRPYALRGNLFAIDVWGLFDKDFSYSPQIHAAIERYFLEGSTFRLRHFYSASEKRESMIKGGYS